MSAPKQKFTVDKLFVRPQDLYLHMSDFYICQPHNFAPSLMVVTDKNLIYLTVSGCVNCCSVLDDVE